MSKTILGVMMGTRDFFPAEPVRQNRQVIFDLLNELDIELVIVDEETTRLGAIETWEDAKKCAALFKVNRDKIEGVLIILPVFAPEKVIADTIKLLGLQVPVLVQAYPDGVDKLAVETRGDAFCGKISACNNLYQYGIPFTLTDWHTVHPMSDWFKADLRKFVGVCKVVNGLKKARLGAIGARPSIFNTVRYSEKLLQASGISVNTVDLFEMFGVAAKFADDVRQQIVDVWAARLRRLANRVSGAAMPGPTGRGGRGAVRRRSGSPEWTDDDSRVPEGTVRLRAGRVAPTR